MTRPSLDALLIVGTMTSESAKYFPGASGDGIITFSLDQQTGLLSRLSEFRDIRSPSYFAYVAAERRLFAVECTFDIPGRLFSFECDSAGRLSLTDSSPTNGL